MSSRAATLVLLALAALLAAGCGSQNVDTERGRTLFVQKCGNCHALDEAATSGVQGPDLDAAFAAARATGMDSDTIEGVVARQIANPRPPQISAAGEEAAITSMPANIVTGQDAADVSAYVASVAGVPGIQPPQVPGGPGAQVFANNGCAGCHTLGAANAAGTTGPDLDEVLAGQSAEQVHRSIVDPAERLTPGYPNLMPTNYEELIPPDELDQLVQYLLENTGSGGGGGNGGGATASGSGGATG